jgi:hypothetical protein
VIPRDKAKLRPVIGQREVVPLKMAAYGQHMKSKKPDAIKSTSPFAQAKPGRTEIRREEPRRSAPRATGNAPERGNQPRSHKSGQK